MAKDGTARLRLRPVGAADRKKLPEYGPLGTGCPAVERAVAALYKGQNEESFWALMNAINYALELDTREGQGPAVLDPAHPEGPVLSAPLHLGAGGGGRQRHCQPPYGRNASVCRHAVGAGL